MQSAVTALAGLAEPKHPTPQCPTLKAVSNRMVLRPMSSLPEMTGAGNASKVQGGNTLEEFKRQLDQANSWEPTQRNERLRALGQEINSMPLEDIRINPQPVEDRLEAIRCFRKVVDALPESERHGLVGMHEAARKDDVWHFIRWDFDALELIKSKMLESKDEYKSHHSRQAIAAEYGLEGHLIRRVEAIALRAFAYPLVEHGSGIREALEEYDLTFERCFGGRASNGYLELELHAFNNGSVKPDLEAREHYQVVAERYGITADYVLQKMIAYQESRGCKVSRSLVQMHIEDKAGDVLILESEHGLPEDGDNVRKNAFGTWPFGAWNGGLPRE